jgi:hypothetical protein
VPQTVDPDAVDAAFGGWLADQLRPDTNARTSVWTARLPTDPARLAALVRGH